MLLRDTPAATRILEAGGKVPNRSVCEDPYFSGASHTCANGRIRNP